ncbi:MAG: SdpI family protein [Candidatus Bathyarchaeia archaeon]
MRINKSEVFVLVLAALSLCVSVCLYPLMPEKVASHWNVRGEVDGYLPKLWGLFLLPIIFAGVALLLIAVPRIDPLRENIMAFRKYYDGFIILFSLFLFSIHLQVILWNIGVRVSPATTVPIGVGLLFFYIGILCENSRRNWFIGIRTPWTLSSDRVWEKTHRLGGKLFKAAGVIAMLGALIQEHAFILILAPIIFAAAYTIIYSYVEYQKEVKCGK